MATPTNIVFDVGNVLIRWDPRLLYRKVFADETDVDAAVTQFLTEICPMEWNVEQDRGRTFADGVALQTARYPQWGEQIKVYDTRWQEMVSGAIEENVALLDDLRAAGHTLYAITNFSAEKWAESLVRFPFLADFMDVVVSAHERVIKPDPAIYNALLWRNNLDAGTCIFIDDSLKNVEGARAVGMRAIHFVEPMDLRAALRDHGVTI